MNSVRNSLHLGANVPVPMGIGLLGFVLDKTELSDDPRIPNVLEEMPAAVLFAFGDDLGKYIAQVRAIDAKRAHKTIIFATINSVAAAKVAVNEWKVDVLVVQGEYKL
jgi:nitronate monooxygenase